jgi:hypothetical protein
MSLKKILHTPVSSRAVLYRVGSLLLTSLLLFFPLTWMQHYLLLKNGPSMPGVIVFNLGHNELQLTTLDKIHTSTFFDFDNESFEFQTAWIGPEAGFLIAGHCPQGKESLTEALQLFGNNVTDGYHALFSINKNFDLTIDKSDPEWSTLKIWIDENKNATCKESELHTLDQLNIKSISLDAESPAQNYIAGNEIKRISHFTYKDGTTGKFYSIVFSGDRTNSHFVGDYTLDTRTLFLPTLRGFGHLPGLHIAMSMDKNLFYLVTNETIAGLNIFSNPQYTQSYFEALLFTWAKVGDIPADSRGPNIDARKLAFMETFMGEKFQHTIPGGPHNPSPQAAALIMKAWEKAYYNLKAAFLIQAGGQMLFADPIMYNPLEGTIEGNDNLSRDGLRNLVAYARKPTVDAKAFWGEVADFLQCTKGLANITKQETSWLERVVKESAPALSWKEVRNERLAALSPYCSAQIKKLP